MRFSVGANLRSMRLRIEAESGDQGAVKRSRARGHGRRVKPSVF